MSGGRQGVSVGEGDGAKVNVGEGVAGGWVGVAEGVIAGLQPKSSTTRRIVNNLTK